MSPLQTPATPPRRQVLSVAVITREWRAGPRRMPCRKHVVAAFASVCGDPRATCSHQRWRLLAEHVHQANETPDLCSGPGRPPLRDAGLSRLQQQAISLRLASTPDRRAARLLGLSPNRYRLQLRAGLNAVAHAMRPGLSTWQPLPADDGDSAPVQPWRDRSRSITSKGP